MTFKLIILLLVGLALIVFGADWLVDGASAIARKAGLSEFVIGLTIVGFGTSCPELVVSLTGALQGNADISIGNVIGSNIFNALFIDSHILTGTEIVGIINEIHLNAGIWNRRYLYYQLMIGSIYNQVHSRQADYFM